MEFINAVGYLGDFVARAVSNANAREVKRTDEAVFAKGDISLQPHSRLNVL